MNAGDSAEPPAPERPPSAQLGDVVSGGKPGIPSRPAASCEYRSAWAGERRQRRAGVCPFKGPVSRRRRPRRRDVPGPPRPEAARFLPSRATAPERLRRRRRRLGAGGPGCSAGAAASSRSPSPPHRVRESRPHRAGHRRQGARGEVAPAAGSWGRREGRAGRGGAAVGSGRRPLGRPRASGRRRRAPAGAGTPQVAGSEGPPRPRGAAPGPTPALSRRPGRGRGIPPFSPRTTLPKARSTQEGPGVTEAPIFSQA